jgi:hypothetical protein
MWRVAILAITIGGWVPSCDWLPVTPLPAVKEAQAQGYPFAYWKESNHCSISDELHCYDYPTLTELVERYFPPEHQALAYRIAFCESSAKPHYNLTHPTILARSTSGAVGWFQHLPQYWDRRSRRAGFAGHDIYDPVANVGVAAWLLANTPQGRGHWWPSRHCWEI